MGCVPNPDLPATILRAAENEQSQIAASGFPGAVLYLGREQIEPMIDPKRQSNKTTKSLNLLLFFPPLSL
jgi:hypothetical protein